MSSERVEMIRQRLTEAFDPVRLEIIDDSHKHAGHAAAGGAGHFTVRIVAGAFGGKSLIERHRLVYGAVEDLMQTHIHALSIEAKSPQETD